MQQLPVPFPGITAPPPDNGEKFLWEYYLAQRERERQHDFEAVLVRCPCAHCVQRRLTCACDSCVVSRGSAPIANATGLIGLMTADPSAAASNLEALATALERDTSGADNPQKARQLRHFATLVRGGNPRLAIEYSKRDGCLVDLEKALSYTTTSTVLAAGPVKRPSHKKKAPLAIGISPTPAPPLLQQPPLPPPPPPPPPPLLPPPRLPP